jgi:tetratricopeptide (TPR) repeat protein
MLAVAPVRSNTILITVNGGVMDSPKVFERYLEARLHIKAAEEFSLQHRKADAVAEYSKAISLEPDNAESYHERALCYAYLGDYECAVDDHTKAIQLEPDYPEAYAFRAAAYYMLMQEDIAASKKAHVYCLIRRCKQDGDIEILMDYITELWANLLNKLKNGTYKGEQEPNMSQEPYIRYILNEAFFIEC